MRNHVKNDKTTILIIIVCLSLGAVVVAAESGDCRIPYRAIRTCGRFEFMCTNGIRECVSMDNVCDGIQNCADNSDEDPKICNDKRSLQEFRLRSRVPVYTIISCATTTALTVIAGVLLAVGILVSLIISFFCCWCCCCSLCQRKDVEKC